MSYSTPTVHTHPAEGDDKLHFLQVFVQDSFEDAAAAVIRLRARGVVVDCRGKSVRFGFGLNHSRQDVKLALDALRADAADVG